MKSALAQTWPAKEIIVVNDGSTDRSLEIASSFESSTVRILDQKNRGASAARNHALLQAQGDFIQFLDADDLLAPDKIELQMNRLAAEPLSTIAAGAWGRFYDEPANTKFLQDPVWMDMSPVDWLVTSWCGGGMMASHSWLTPRSVIGNAGLWDETPSPIDDGEFFTRVLLSSSGVAFCPEARSYYRSGLPGSWSGTKTPEALNGIFHSIELSTSHLLSRESSPRVRRACAAHFQQFVYDIYPLMPDLIAKAEARIASLGGSDHELNGGGKLFRLLVSGLGWKSARQIQLWNRKLRHN
jgi:glycosyltransferase involved in cell wall biosynthesis